MIYRDMDILYPPKERKIREANAAGYNEETLCDKEAWQFEGI